MNSLQEMFPSLTLFSDLDWNTVTAEYKTEYEGLTFPEYLQQKAIDGDCPTYLFELAFYEQAIFDVKNSAAQIPNRPAVYLNPTALFLELEFDIKRMLLDAQAGKIEIHQRPHVLCIYRDTKSNICTMELNARELSLLQHLENGPQFDRSFLDQKLQPFYENFKQNELILDLLSL